MIANFKDEGKRFTRNVRNHLKPITFAGIVNICMCAEHDDTHRNPRKSAWILRIEFRPKHLIQNSNKIHVYVACRNK